MAAVVTYHDEVDGSPRAAVVTHTFRSINPTAVAVEALPPITHTNRCHLHVFTPGGYKTAYNIPPGDQPGQWSWPSQA